MAMYLFYLFKPCSRPPEYHSAHSFFLQVSQQEKLFFPLLQYFLTPALIVWGEKVECFNLIVRLVSFISCREFVIQLSCKRSEYNLKMFVSFSLKLIILPTFLCKYYVTFIIQIWTVTIHKCWIGFEGRQKLKTASISRVDCTKFYTQSLARTFF